MNFEELGLNAQLLEGIEVMGYKSPSPIQEQAIPHILNNQDVIACAQTGTGKTAAFLLPVLHKIMGNNRENLDTLIISPTRELATQISRQADAFAYYTDVASYAVYGGGTGESFDYEKRALTQGVEVIIGTPGRLLSHLNLGYVKFDKFKHLILDEADRMLDMGFFDDIMKIIGYLPKERTTLMFSATMPPKIRQLALKVLKDPVTINISISKPAEGITQLAYLTHDNQKVDLAKHVLEKHEASSVIVFCSRKKDVDILARELRKKNIKAEGIHSDLEQDKREQVLQQYKNKDFQVLVATDIMSRGIDIEEIGMVINYDVPPDAEDYVHRIGRTARANTKGIGVTFINAADQHKFQRIEKLIERVIEKTPNPDNIGPGPEYKENARPSGGGYKGKGGGGGGKKRYSNNRNGGGNKSHGNRGGEHKPRRD